MDKRLWPQLLPCLAAAAQEASDRKEFVFPEYRFNIFVAFDLLFIKGNLLKLKNIISIVAVFLAIQAGGAFALGTFIPSANRVDMVHDAQRGVVYITDGGNVLRYDIPSATFLSPIALGGQLNGIDISPDGTTLAVADRTSTAIGQWVYLIRLSDLAINTAYMTKEFMEDGMWAVAYAFDGSLIASSRFAGSGWVPMRKLDPGSTMWTKLGAAYPDNTFRQNSMVSASGNGKVIAFAEANSSDGPWGIFDESTGQLVRREGYTDGTSAFNFEIATNANGSQYAVPTYHGTYIYNSAYSKVATIGQDAGVMQIGQPAPQQPVGVAYHPVESLIYFPWVGTGEVRVYEATGFTQVGSYNFEDTFAWNGGNAFIQGRTRISKDGSLLMVSVTGGVRILQMYAPLFAAPVAANSDGAPVTLPLNGSIGNGGQLTYSVVQQPSHGSVTVSGATATYVPAAGFSGSDSFKYRVSYGGATADASGTITVTQNQAPTAIYQMVNAVEDTPVAFSLQATDPEGDALSYSILTQPLHGVLSGSGSARVYTPAANFNGLDSFTFSANDGQLTSNVATIYLRVASVNDAPIARPDSATTVRNTAVTIAVLANDADPDGDMLALGSVSSPAHGSAVISGANIVYTPARGFFGTDQFTYTISDWNGGNASAVVTVNVLKK